MAKYKAAVIIPTRGGASKLHYPLDALEQQTEKDFQVIVVCDGDIDGSEALVETYKKRGNLNIQAIVFPENRGRVKALNAGHQAADADILIRCDDDLQPDPAYVANHLAHHSNGKEVGVIGIYLNKYPETPYSRAYGVYRDEKFRQDAYSASADIRWRYWAGNVSMSANLFDKLGGYDEGYRLYGWEDVDMGYMIHKSGAQVIIAPELATKHYVAATTTAGRATRALHSGSARSIFVEKHGESVLPDPTPTGLWGNALKLVAAVSTEKTISLMGNAVDKLADHLPQKVAEKLISLLVESAGYAGIRYPKRAQKVF